MPRSGKVVSGGRQRLPGACVCSGFVAATLCRQGVAETEERRRKVASTILAVRPYFWVGSLVLEGY